MKLATLDGMNTRPTTDRVKESLFNILNFYLEGCSVLDLFGGSGSLGIEALSRGASSVVFADKSEKCIEIIKQNVTHTRFLDKSEIYLGEYDTILKKLSLHGKKFDIIFLDPPYKLGVVPEILLLLQSCGILNDKVIIVVESDGETVLPEVIGDLCISRVQSYGNTKITFYKWA